MIDFINMDNSFKEMNEKNNLNFENNFEKRRNIYKNSFFYKNLENFNNSDIQRNGYLTINSLFMKSIKYALKNIQNIREDILLLLKIVLINYVMTVALVGNVQTLNTNTWLNVQNVMN